MPHVKSRAFLLIVSDVTNSSRRRMNVLTRTGPAGGVVATGGSNNATTFILLDLLSSLSPSSGTLSRHTGNPVPRSS